jgi:translation initiation factor IF-2
MNVEQFATELKVDPALLVKQLQAAGVTVAGTQEELSDQDKTRLLDYLRGKHGAKEPKTKITLTRKQSSEIKTADSAGRTRTVQVEVRKKRVLVKREGAGPRPPRRFRPLSPSCRSRRAAVGAGTRAGGGGSARSRPRARRGSDCP